MEGRVRGGDVKGKVREERGKGGGWMKHTTFYLAFLLLSLLLFLDMPFPHS